MPGSNQEANVPGNPNKPKNVDKILDSVLIDALWKYSVCTDKRYMPDDLQDLNNAEAYQRLTSAARLNILRNAFDGMERLLQDVPKEFGNHINRTIDNRIENLTNNEALTIFLIKNSLLSQAEVSTAFKSYNAAA